MTNGNHLTGSGIERNGAGFVENDAFTLDVDERVGSSEIDRDVSRE